MAGKLSIDLTQDIKRLNIIAKHLVSNKTVGRYKSKFKGKGIEFSQYRQYNASLDDAALIDWKASKRANELLIKEFVEERNMHVFFLIDVSATMISGTTKFLKMEYAAHLAASLYYTILAAGDIAGFALFSDGIVAKQVPSSGKDAFYKLSRALVDINNYGGKYDLGEAIRLTLAFLKQNDVLIIVSDFIGLKPGWEQTVKIAAAKYDTVAIMIRDPNDKIMPTGVGQVVLENPYTGRQLLIQPEKVKVDYERVVRQEEAEIKEKFQKMNVDFLTLTTDEPFINPVISFFRRREG